jgi:hypothetical protein
MPNDHYVPQFLLKNFSCSSSKKQDQVWVYDKVQNTKPYKTKVRNICAENDYNFPVVERLLSGQEGVAKTVIDSIIKNRQIGHLSNSDKITLQVFLALQFCRTRNMRQRMLSVQEGLRDKIINDFGAEYAENTPFLLEEEQIKIFSTDFFLRNVPELAFHLSYKEWILYENTHNLPLYCSDNPLVFHNENNFGFYGNIGFTVKGIQIYLPISSNLILSVSCHSNNEELRAEYSKLQNSRNKLLATSLLSPRGYLIKDQNKQALDLIEIEIQKGKDRFEKIEKGLPLIFEYETLKFFNGLQIRDSERFIISSTNDFSMADEFLNLYPHRRQGPRFDVNENQHLILCDTFFLLLYNVNIALSFHEYHTNRRKYSKIN